jgi:hypothetical protein
MQSRSATRSTLDPPETFKDPVDVTDGLELSAEVLIHRAHPDVRHDLRFVLHHFQAPDTHLWQRV